MGILNEKSPRKSTDERYAVDNCIKNKNKTSQKIPGIPANLSPRNKRAIFRDVRKSGKTVSQIQLPGDINVSRWGTLKNCPNVEYSKGQKAPSWKENLLKASLAFMRFCNMEILIFSEIIIKENIFPQKF